MRIRYGDYHMPHDDLFVPARPCTVTVCPLCPVREILISLTLIPRRSCGGARIDRSRISLAGRRVGGASSKPVSLRHAVLVTSGVQAAPAARELPYIHGENTVGVGKGLSK